MNMLIRPYHQDDLNDLLASWENASKIAHPFLKEDFLAQEKKNISEIYLPNTDTWVAEAGNSVIGFITLAGNEVAAIFIQPEHQGKKIGQRLMAKAQALCGDLEVEVFEKNSIGRHFYSNYGFTLLGASVHEPTGEHVLRLRFTDGKTT